MLFYFETRGDMLSLPIQVVLLVNLTDIPLLLLLPSVTCRALQVEVVLCAQNGCTAKYLNQGVIPKDMTTAVGSTAASQVEFQQAASSVANLSGVTVAILGQAGGAQLRDQIGTGGNCALSTLGLNWHEVSILVAWFRFHPHSYIPKFYSPCYYVVLLVMTLYRYHEPMIYPYSLYINPLNRDHLLQCRMDPKELMAKKWQLGG